MLSKSLSIIHDATLLSQYSWLNSERPKLSKRARSETARIVITWVTSTNLGPVLYFFEKVANKEMFKVNREAN